MKKLYPLLTLIVFNFLFTLIVFSQQNSGTETVGTPWDGGKGVTVTVEQMMQQEKMLPARPFKVRPRHEFEAERNPKDNPNALPVATWPPDAQQSQQPGEGTTAPQTIGTSWLGPQISDTPGWVPPDIVGDVGPTQVLTCVNGRFRIFDKSGTMGSFNVYDSLFWASVSGGTDVTDPHVRYDPISQRWFLCEINMPSSGSNRVMIAVSSGSTITNSSSFTLYSFKQDTPTPVGSDNGGFADYPTLGVDANALYIGVNVFNAAGTALIGSSAFVVKKSSLISGTLTVTVFRDIYTSSVDGPYTPQGVQNDDASATEGYFIGVDGNNYSQLDIRRISNPGGTPSISSNLVVTVPTTTAPISQPAQSSYTLDPVDDRLFAAMMKKNKQTGTISLWTAHNIQVNSSGVGSNSGGRNGSRWYEITNLTGTPTLRQSGTIYSTATSNPIGYWIPSVAMSGQGHMALGCSFAGNNNYPSVAVTGRLSSDALGTTQALTTAVTGAYGYKAESSGPERWGDFTQTVVDPTDDMTMWSFQEYVNAANSWALRVIKLVAPPPATPSSTSPSTVNTGASNVNVTLTGTSSSGSGFFDPGTGFTNRLAASVSGTGVTVNSITFSSATSITLNLTIASNATSGGRTITVTNPDGQAATSASSILTVSSVTCPTISLTPTTLTSGNYGASYNQSVTASGGVSPYTYSLSAGALPTGLSLSSGGAITGTPTQSGTFYFTVTASDSNSCSGSKQDTLTINPCPAISITPSTLTNGAAGSSYNQALSASGGTAAYTYAVTSGSLPSGVSLSSGGVLSGTPANGGSYTFTVTATDAHTCTGSQAYTWTVTGCPAITVSPSTLPGGIINGSYNQTITASGGTANYTYAVTAGSLPTGLSLTSGGSLSGTTTAAGTFSFTITTTDANSCTGNRAYSVTISTCPTITLSPSTLSNGTQNVAYSQTITASGGTAAYTYAVTSGSLPTGISLSSGGALTGTPTVVGSSTFTVTATDANSCTGAQSYTLQVNAASGNMVSLTTAGSAYTQDFNTLPSSGTSDSALPAGWSIYKSTAPTNHSYTIGTGSSTTGNAYDFGTASSTDRALGGLASNATIPAWGAGFTNNTGGTITSLAISYNEEQWRLGVTSHTTSLDTTKFQFSTDATSLSTGTWTSYDSLRMLSVVLSGTVGALDGNASANRKSITYTISGLSITNGSTFFIRWNDVNISGSDDGLAVDDFSITPYTTLPSTNPSMTVSATPDTVQSGNATLLKAAVTAGTNPTSSGLAVTADLSSIGGSASQTFYDDGTHGDVTSGDNVFSFSATVTGGTSAGTKSLPFTVTDAQSRSGNANLSLLVTSPGCPAIMLSPSTLPDDTIGTAYNQTITASGGKTPYSYLMTAGALPTGLSLSSGGALTGTPTATGTFTFTVTATDSNSCTGTQSYTIHVLCPTITVSPSTLPGGTTGNSYSQNVTAAGGKSPYTFTVSSGTQPNGTTLSSAGVLSGTLGTVGSYTFTVTATDSNGCTGSKSYTVQISAPVVTISLTTSASAYTQNFDSLANTGTSSTLPTGWLLYETGTAANTSYTAGTGSSNTGDTYSFGDSATTDRALGGVQSGNLIPSWGAGFTNNTGSTVTSMQITYTGEEWRLGTASRLDSIKFQLSTDASNISGGTWTQYNSLCFVTPDTSTVGAKTGNASINRTQLSSLITGLNIPNGSTFFIRWVDYNATGADDGLAVDDLSLTPFVGVTPTNPTIAGTATPDTVQRGNATLITATVTAGTNPASTGLAVTGNLTAIGGSASQTFYDDGTHGDATAGDNIFSYSATVPSNTSAGTKSIGLSVTDAQSRNASTSFTLTVTLPPCPTITLSPASLPNAQAGTAYNQTFTGSGGASPYTFTTTSGSLPAGLTLSSDGNLSGTPTGHASASFTITATDFNGCTGSQAYTVTTICPTITVSPSTLPGDTSGKAYSHQLSASGGKSPYTHAVSSGSLPAGTTLSSAGLVSGTLGASGSYSFTVTATDSNGCTGSQDYTVNVAEAIASISVAVQARWNIVSNPVIVTNDSVQALYPGAASPPFAFTSLGYQSKSRIINGSGYWLKFPASANVLLSGKPLISDTVDVMTGWNMIGSVSHAIAASSVTSIPSGIQTGSFFKYNAGYLPTDSINPGKGYWVKVSQAGKLILSSSSLLAANRINIAPDGELPPEPPVENSKPEQVPTAFALDQNYPNPFNPTTNFGIHVADAGMVSLKVYDVLGREVATIVNQEMNAGSYTIQWDANSIPSGVYYYRMTAGSFSDMKKLLLMK